MFLCVVLTLLFVQSNAMSDGSISIMAEKTRDPQNAERSMALAILLSL